MFWIAWEQAMTPQNIASGWRNTGIFPWNPDQVLGQFNIEEEVRPSSSQSSTSVLGPDDWKNLRGRLITLIRDHDNSDIHTLDREVRAFTWDVHEIRTTNLLLEGTVRGYQEVVKNEQKKRSRGVPLMAQLALNEDGRACFFSPEKVRQARDLLQEKEDAKARDEALKAEDKVQKQLAKEEKDRLAEEKRINRALAKERREELEAAKRAQIVANKEVRAEAKKVKEAKKVMDKSRKARQGVFTIPEEPFVEVIREEEEWNQKSASSHPQRQRRPPKWLDNTIITIE
jgi:hypothetical protein